MKLSIIVPVYNCLGYLKNCIDSILGQTYKNLELIIVDDGSTDGSSELCDRYMEKDQRVVVIHQNNGGVSSARNAGLAVCTGDYAMFVDADDWLQKDACEQCVGQLDEHTSICFFSCNKVVGDKVEKQGDVVAEQSLEALIADIIACPGYQFYYIRAPWAKLYKRELLENVLFSEKIYIGEDACFLLKLLSRLKNIEQVKFCKGNWYYYRILQNSAVRRYKTDLFFQSNEQYQYIRKLMSMNGIENHKVIKTALVMLNIDLLVALKSNDMAANPQGSDCRKWMRQQAEILSVGGVDLKRFSKFQLLLWMTYKLFRGHAAERLLEMRVRQG